MLGDDDPDVEFSICRWCNFPYWGTMLCARCAPWKTFWAIMLLQGRSGLGSRIVVTSRCVQVRARDIEAAYLAFVDEEQWLLQRGVGHGCSIHRMWVGALAISRQLQARRVVLTPIQRCFNVRTLFGC